MNTRRTYWTCQTVGWGVYSAIGVVSAAQEVGWRSAVVIGYVLFAIYSIALTDLFRREMLRREWLDLGGGRMAAVLALGVVVVGSIQTFLVVAVDMTLSGSRSTFRKPAYIEELWMGVCGATAMWTILYVAMTARRRSREKQVHLELALRDAELRALEAQIHPHFLFNSLNSIRGLVLENPPLAQDMVTRLSNILRYNLRRDTNHAVPLASEVEVVTDYLALESVRLEDRLKVEMAIQPGAEAVPFPAMLLQTLVENAVKYGVAPLREGGELRIQARLDGDALELEVANPGRLAEGHGRDGGVGLANARDRLRLLYGGRASLRLENRDGGVTATVRVPRST
jgi:hypothetical protein